MDHARYHSIKKWSAKLLGHLPGRGTVIRDVYHRLKYEKRKLERKVKNSDQIDDLPDPDQIYWIDPKKIVYHTNYLGSGGVLFKDRVFDMQKDKGCVYDGDWDLSNFKFSELDAFKAIEQRMKEGRKWAETFYYRYELAQIEANKIMWGCRSREEWDARFVELDSLIQSIRENGYVVGNELLSANGKLRPFLRMEMADFITVNIGRKGQYLFQDGRHRLAIAQILGIKGIPVKVLVRHKKFQESRKR